MRRIILLFFCFCHEGGALYAYLIYYSVYNSAVIGAEVQEGLVEWDVNFVEESHCFWDAVKGLWSMQVHSYWATLYSG